MIRTNKAPNAQKWTVERVCGHLDRVEVDIENERCFFLGWSLKRQGLPGHVWSYWKKIFADNDDMLERMLLIDTAFEAKILQAGLDKVLPANIVMQTLRCTYGWRTGTKAKSVIHNDLF